MAVRPRVGLSGWLHEQLAAASPDLLRGMVKTSAEALMSAEADASAVPRLVYVKPRRVIPY
jgi:hypothetical protein